MLLLEEIELILILEVEKETSGVVGVVIIEGTDPVGILLPVVVITGNNIKVKGLVIPMDKVGVVGAIKDQGASSVDIMDSKEGALVKIAEEITAEIVRNH